MKANELRLGNLIRYTNEKDLNRSLRGTVLNVDIDTLMYVENNVRADFYEPIQLTPSVLEAAGFEYIPEGLLYADKHHCIYEGGKISGEIWKFQPFCTIDHDCTVSLHYLHQLQNLIFALTGTELEIDIEKLK